MMRAPGIALLLALAACGSTDRDRAELQVMVVGDAAAPNGIARRLGAELTQPTLVARDENGRVIAGLATSWRFVDAGRSLIMRLKPMEWRDGRPLVAKDVVSSFRRLAQRREPLLLGAGIAGAGKAAASAIGVLAPIARVVEVRLDRPSPHLLEWLATPELAVSRPTSTLAVWEGIGAADKRMYKRRDAEGEAGSQIKRIAISGRTDAASGVGDFLAGNTDVLIGDGLAGLGEARARAPVAALRIDPLFGFYGYCFNLRRPALADAGLRRALADAIDRPALLARYGIAAMTPMHNPMPDSVPALPAADGVAPSPPLPVKLTLLLPEGIEHRHFADAMAQTWAALGVTLAISVAPVAEFKRLLAKGDYDLALVETSLVVPDTIALLGSFRCAARLYCNPAADALLDRAATSDDSAPALAELAALYDRDPPAVILFRPIRWALVGRRVQGWVPNAAGLHPLDRLTLGSPS